MAQQEPVRVESPRHNFEMILLGDLGVGKTTLFIYLQTGKYVSDDARLTVGVDIAYKQFNIDGQEVGVKINDTGGNERFRTLTAGFYRHAQIVLLMYNIEDQYTLQSLPDWITECKQQNEAPDNLFWVLIGNKCDLDNEVEASAVESFCQEHEIKSRHFITAKTGENVDKMMETILRAVIKRSEHLESPAPAKSTQAIRVGTTASKPADKKCNC